MLTLIIKGSFNSGKKKKHTLKNLAITDHQGYIEFISESYLGSTHDKVIWDQIDVDLKDFNLLADLGFVGIEKTNLMLFYPTKNLRGEN